VLLEDLGAQVGLIVALVAVTLAEITGEPRWDGAGTLIIGLLLIVIAVILAVEMKGLLIGESASTADQEKIVAAIEVEPSVQRLIHMRTQHIGPEELLVGAKIELIPDLSVAEAAETVDRIEASVRRAVPIARIMYLEPDIFRTQVPADEPAPAHLESS
jgi:divalent metal cation (Fe/Co/Zn/Cd) transporter